MKLSVRAATMVVVVILMMAMVAPSATAVAPGRRAQRVHCSSSSQHYRRWHQSYWVVTFVLKNDRKHRSTVHGSWRVEGASSDRTVRHHADLAAGARKSFSKLFDGGPNAAPAIDLLRCR